MSRTTHRRGGLAAGLRAADGRHQGATRGGVGATFHGLLVARAADANPRIGDRRGRVSPRPSAGGPRVPLPRPVKPHAVRPVAGADRVDYACRSRFHRDGRLEVTMSGASAFPRGTGSTDSEGALVLKSAVTRQQRVGWTHSFGTAHALGRGGLARPCGGASEVRAGASSCPHGLMRGAAAAEIRRLPARATVTGPGGRRPAAEVSLVLDGVLRRVGRRRDLVGEVGPGAVRRGASGDRGRCPVHPRWSPERTPGSRRGARTGGPGSGAPDGHSPNLHRREDPLGDGSGR